MFKVSNLRNPGMTYSQISAAVSSGDSGLSPAFNFRVQSISKIEHPVFAIGKLRMFFPCFANTNATGISTHTFDNQLICLIYDKVVSCRVSN